MLTKQYVMIIAFAGALGLGAWSSPEQSWANASHIETLENTGKDLGVDAAKEMMGVVKDGLTGAFKGMFKGNSEPQKPPTQQVTPEAKLPKEDSARPNEGSSQGKTDQ